MDDRRVPRHGSGGDVDEAVSRLSLLTLAAYLAVLAIPLASWTAQSREWAPMVVHLSALAWVIVARTRGSTLPSVVRDWTPLACGPLLYTELRWVIEGAGQPHFDAVVRGWEAAVFSTDPSRTLVSLWPSLLVSEVLHFCYISYFALVYVPPLVMAARANRRAVVATMLALVIVYTLCFVPYIVFPVDGPRYLLGPSAAPDGPIRRLALSILETGSSRGTAFPSSHVAAAVVASICALRFHRPTGIMVALLTAGVAVGAVYGGYHYAVDVVAGVATGITAAVVARIVESRLETRGARTAPAVPPIF